MPNKCKNCVHEKVCRIKEFPSIEEILKTGCDYHISLENVVLNKVVSKSKYQSVVNENAKLTDCVQDLLKDQDVLKQLLEKEREKSEKIFEEIEVRLKNLDSRYMNCGDGKKSWGVRGALHEITEIKKEYKGETK